MDPLDAAWRKSSYSSNTGACVEVAEVPSGTHVRDSLQPELGHLTFASTEWSVFVTSVKE
ncbi:uncharacterized protein DUF397 [Nocardiopsis sp. Huas11]|uniref:DUF397 domain-containing protein n=1 Tax=Nocardiopsis sp. Huas11 TaxID=2183912 RepID=UPI000EADBE8A|nr:DUF397 domain-containing protein [Nocardiopsis sp. Huas11]RKS10405.1 uncharacterized protein DUF397 [Nocardiopsis sp. Huas11]